jgi:hypothetical protein
MAGGSRIEADKAPDATTASATQSAPAVADAGGERHPSMMFGLGHIDPDALAAMHASMGNSAVQSMLGFDDPFDFNKPRIPKTTVPMTNEEGLKALTDKRDAERLLTGKGMDASKQAAQALDILVNIPDSQRGKVIDELEKKAFDNLLDRLSDADQERLMRNGNTLGYTFALCFPFHLLQCCSLALHHRLGLLTPSLAQASPSHAVPRFKASDLPFTLATGPSSQASN